MRRIVTAISAAALSLSLVGFAFPADAAAGFDSAYAGESAFLTLNAGQSGTFTVFFANTGTNSWVKGTATQVDLAACLEDKTTCNQQNASEAPFNSGWLSATRYATHTQTTVAPGSIGTFTYNVAVAAGQAAGTYRFNGALVVSSTGADVHNEGYFQDVTVPAPPAVSCTPTKIELSPTTANNQVGVTHTETATVTCEPATGSTTRVLTANAQVTFVIDAPVGSLNADLTLTATTNDKGVATVSWTRSNPDVDSITAYPTSFPAVRATATKTWSAGTSVITCTPTDAATLLAGASRTYTVQVNSPTTGSASTNTVTVSQGSSDTLTLSATTLTPDSTGKALFSVTGADAATGTPKVKTTFKISGNDTDFTATCGKTTFEAVKAATITVTPDTTATSAASGNREFTVTAVDQFGSAYTGLGVRFSFTEFTDSDTSTTTNAIVNVIAQKAATALSTSCTTPDGLNQNKSVTLSSTGTAFVQICSTTKTTGTPIAWFDKDGNLVPSTGEAQDTGGATTWAAAAVTSARLRPTSATNAASSDTTLALDSTAGEETFNTSVRDQSGNLTTLSDDAIVTFTIRNTGASTVAIVDCRGGVSSTSTSGGATGTTSGSPIVAGGSGTCTATIAKAGTPTSSTSFATTTIDSNGDGSATVDCTVAVGSTIFTCTQATKTWVKAGTFIVTPATSITQATGTVVAFDTGRSYYAISTTAGNFTIFYGGADRFTVDGTTSSMSLFSDNLSLGDQITFKGGKAPGQSPVDQASHDLVNK